eukprot:CAMPEP_0178510484 /NCGR_PEP_ID=MMETSP0696-20121128/21855_1 /TAXON_ID=265572 /ORGANISM="Extubocellulus spinifer, Strain CCMP396" /LENGTH=175 /DNA_ID=CAMNT_0020140197 /DNA_START=80 /DNA_END=608 /DNA_ORIENTATION=-
MAKGEKSRKKSTTASAASGKKRPRSTDTMKPASTSGKKTCSKSDAQKETKGGLDLIDDLFAAKRTADKQQKIQDEKDEKERKRRRRERRGSGGGGAIPPARKGKSMSSLSYTRDDAGGLKGGEWANDGMGGIFDSEGYTGRKADGGMKIYKAHLFNKEGFGTTKDCPFDCDCCYI